MSKGSGRDGKKRESKPPKRDKLRVKRLKGGRARSFVKTETRDERNERNRKEHADRQAGFLRRKDQPEGPEWVTLTEHHPATMSMTVEGGTLYSVMGVGVTFAPDAGDAVNLRLELDELRGLVEQLAGAKATTEKPKE